MGTWGTGLLENDLVMDAYHALGEAIDAGKPLDQALTDVLQEYECWGEPDTHVRLGLASVLLEMGVTDHPLLHEAREIIVSGADLQAWRDGSASEETIKERTAVLQEFLTQLPTKP